MWFIQIVLLLFVLLCLIIILNIINQILYKYYSHFLLLKVSGGVYEKLYSCEDTFWK